MDDRLRQILEGRPGVFVSGEEIGRLIGNSRAAVWKQIRSLRSRGYEIEGARGAGYRLLGRPDLIQESDLRARLRENSLFRTLEYFPVTDSTNARATELAEQGAPHGTLACADAQTGGRGRLGRKWSSPPALNLYFTLILRPPIEPVVAPQLTLVAAVALAQAVEDATGLACALKWPNDLFIGGRKAAGILAEMAADPDSVRHVALGIGLNVNGLPEDFPPEFREKATTLRIESGKRHFRVDVLAAFLNRFTVAYRDFLSGGFPAIRSEWNRRSLLDGRRVLLRQRSEAEWGTVEGVDDDGVLVFRKEGGSASERVHSGEIMEFER
jgi:BirA family biotin operon repressor/biotin-[acetyl-CoA-carboxylase] ligase